MEDASGEDLDWFWRGWFYGTDVTDISLDTVKYFRPDVECSAKCTSEIPLLQRKLTNHN